MRHLAEAVAYFRGYLPPPQPKRAPSGDRSPPAPDLADVRGQERARRVLEIAAAGGHNLLLAGPPGIGKTMLARRLPGVMPPLDDGAALEVTRIHSVAGVLPAGAGLVRTPPFRAPHHTASAAAIVGGGSSPRPGEVTLAHHGVLLLDELPEFSRLVLEALRQPLEDGTVSIARVAGRWLYPARFSPHRDDEPLSVRRPRRRPVELLLLAAAASTAIEASSPVPCSTASTSSWRCRGRGRRSSRRRPASDPRRCAATGRGGSCGAGFCDAVVHRRAADELLARAVERLPLSGRGRARVARVARTIAALAGFEGRAAGAPGRGALLPLARGAREPMSELALALYAASREAHAADRDRLSAGFAAYLDGFDEVAERSRLAASGIRWLARSDSAFPARLASIHDPPPRTLPAWSRRPGSPGRSRPSRSSVLARAATTGLTLRARWPGRSPLPESSWSRASPAGSTAGRTAAASIRAAGPSPCSAAASTATTRALMRASRAEIAATGLVVSEYPPGVAPAPWRFPARNRIVAGLAVATVVVEARERSGALITADLALEEGREVLAVPGEITSALSEGANALLRLGATPVTGAADVLEAIGVEAPGAPPDDHVPGPAAAAALAALEQGAATADQVARQTGLDPATVAAALVELELAGLVEARAGIYRA